MYLAKRAFFALVLLYSIISAYNAEHPNWKLVDRKECGKNFLPESMFRTPSHYPQTEMGKYPWLALLARYDIWRHVIYYGGGSLINKNYVLTSASSIFFGKFKTCMIKLGEYNVDTDKDCVNDNKCAPPVQLFKPAKMILHSLYKEKEVQNDIGLIRLDRPAKLNSMVYPICLPYPGFVSKWGTIFHEAGWGMNSRTRYNDLMKLKISRETTVKKWRLARCKVPYLLFFTPSTVAKNLICGLETFQRDSCVANTGGPLMQKEIVDHGNYKYFVIGINSYFGANTRCNSRFPTVYTNVTRYIDWILDNITD